MILCWTVYAHRQLTLEELQHALATRTGDSSLDEDGIVDQDICLQCCQGLVTVDTTSRLVRLVHYSAQEYFDRVGLEYFPDARIILTDPCLTYLRFTELKRGLAHYDNSFIAEEYQIESLEQTGLIDEKRKGRPLLDYAASCWGYHAQGIVESTLRNEILAFLRDVPALLNSVQILLRSLYPVGLYARMVDCFPFGQDLTLWVTIYFGLQTTVELLLREPAKAEQLDMILGWSIKCSESNIALLLVRKGANLSGIYDCRSNLSLAIERYANYSPDIGFGEGFIWDLLAVGNHQTVNEEDLAIAARRGNAMVMEMVADLYIRSASTVLEKQKLCRSLARIAVEKFCCDFLTKALNEGCDLESKDDEGLTIIQSIFRLSGPFAVHMIEQVLDAGADITALTDNGESVLHLTLRHVDDMFIEGENRALEWLLEERKGDLDLDCCDGYGKTPLCLAAEAGKATAVQLLLVHGADVGALSRAQRSLLHLASPEFGRLRILLHTITYKWELNQLLHAAKIANSQRMWSLLDDGADVASRNIYKESILHVAISNFHVMKSLLQRVSGLPDVNCRDMGGRTPLHHAAAGNRLTTMQVLVDAGAQINAKDDTGATILHLGVRSASAIQFALGHGVDVNSKDHASRTVLHWLALLNLWQDSHSVLELLADAGIDRSTEDSQGRTAAYYIIAEGEPVPYDQHLHEYRVVGERHRWLNSIQDRCLLEKALEWYKEDDSEVIMDGAEGSWWNSIY